MAKSSHRFRVHEARRVNHPVWNAIEKHNFTIAAKDLPKGISTSANARDPVGLNRRVYRDVMDSLLGNTSVPGTFDLMNKGITILADSVKLVDKDKGIYDVVIEDDIGGIVDGAHTAALIWQAQDRGEVPNEQYVDIYVRTGVDRELFSDIAKGLNTAIQVKTQSIFDIDGVFDWLKNEIKGESYADMIAYKESDDTDYDVRDLIGVLEVFNIYDYPAGSGQHPVSAYEKWSVPLENFGKDYQANKSQLSRSKYYRLRPILKDALTLYDSIRHDFRKIHNDSGGKAGNMKIIEEAGKRTGDFTFPFANLTSERYRLTKGAAYPILAAFRNYAELDKDGVARWRGGFGSILRAWREIGPALVAETVQATQDISRYPEQLGKNRKHWSDLYRVVETHLLRERLAAAEAASGKSAKTGKR